MDDEPPRKKLRKGTKSCIECRRRKIRCTWTNDQDTTCDGCLARSLGCRSQELAVDSDTEPVTSRDRVGRLERRLEDLADRVKYLEHADFYSSEHPSSARDEANGTAPLDLPGGNPTHIRSLFEGAFVATGGTVSQKGSGSPTPPPSARGFVADRDALRRDLTRLLPTDRDVRIVLQFTIDWWSLLDTVMPPLSIHSKEEFKAGLDRVRRPDCDPTQLAVWLVTAAITVQAFPPNVDRFVLDDPAQLRDFPEAVMARLEHMLATHNDLAATLPGIESSLLLVRLQMNCGRVRRAWLTLRHAIACAELSGFQDLVRLPDAMSPVTGQDGTPAASQGSPEEGLEILKASIWVQLCLFERLIGAMLNLSSTTRERPPLLPQYFLRNPSHVLGREFFWALSNVAIKIRERDDLVRFPEKDWVSETLSIERDMQELADAAGVPNWIPNSPWANREPGGPLPLLHQHMYFYLLLRTHLPLMLQVESDQCAHRSYALCLYACSQMARVYIQQSKPPMHGLFPVRLTDFMAFTAIAIMMLDREGVLRNGTFLDPGLDTNIMTTQLEELIGVLERAALQEGRVIAAQAVKAVDSVRKTLSTKDPASPGTSIRIPLLGTMRIRRRAVRPPEHNLRTPVSTYDFVDGDQPQQLQQSLQQPQQPRRQQQLQQPQQLVQNPASTANTSRRAGALAGRGAPVNNAYPASMHAPGMMNGTTPSAPNNGVQASQEPVPLGDGDWAEWVAEAMSMTDPVNAMQDPSWMWGDDNTFRLGV